uniref:Cation/H+ exchanger transmembrane domain-containing protein n=1 Tax=Leersia perrieri TaxID=77586 RepID=A0A0D9VVQ5_9ORYZ
MDSLESTLTVYDGFCNLRQIHRCSRTNIKAEHVPSNLETNLAINSVCTLQVLNQDETPLLYSLVFGGVVNDATSVVLFNAIQNFDLANFSSWTSKCLYHKKLYFGRHSTDREVSIMMLMAYLPYMLSELLDLSGILTVFFCGIVMSHHTQHNVTEFQGHNQVIIWWADLMRGAVSIVVAYNKREAEANSQQGKANQCQPGCPWPVGPCHSTCLQGYCLPRGAALDSTIP